MRTVRKVRKGTLGHKVIRNVRDLPPKVTVSDNGVLVSVYENKGRNKVSKENETLCRTFFRPSRHAETTTTGRILSV